jgi:hypothetical protein
MMCMTGDIMEIHLSKPGGQQEGPYTLEQINQDLAANKYSDTDYWAWHEGLTEWVPLYELPGVVSAGNAAASEAATSEPEAVEMSVEAEETMPPVTAAVVSAAPASAKPQQPPAVPPSPATPAARIAPKPQPTAPGSSTAGLGPPPAAPLPEPEEEPAAARAQIASGMPSAALEQIFVFTTGDGPSAWHSPTVARMLKEIIGEDPSALGEAVLRDVVAWCAVGELFKPDGSISDTVWRAMAVHRPVIVQDARDRLYRVCVRTFRIEADAIVALVLFYNKQKLQPT